MLDYLGYRYRNRTPRYIKFLIGILFLSGLFAILREDIWYMVVLTISWILLYFLIASLLNKGIFRNKDKIIAIDIFKLYKEFKLRDPNKKEEDLLRQTASSFYSSKNMSKDFIEEAITRIPKDDLFDLIYFVLINEEKFLDKDLMIKNFDKRRKVVEDAYYKVFKKKWHTYVLNKDLF